MATFKVGDKVNHAFGHMTNGIVKALSISADLVRVQWGDGDNDCAWHGRSVLEHAPEAKPAWVRPEYVGTGSCTSPSAVLHGIDRGTSREPDDTLPPQRERYLRGLASNCDGATPVVACLPDIIPAAVLARRAAGYRRVSVPTDTDDHLIPDAEPEGIVPRGAR